MTEDCIDSHLSASNSSNRQQPGRAALPAESSRQFTSEMMLTQTDHASFESHPLATHKRPSSQPSGQTRPLSDLVPSSLIHSGEHFGPIPNLFKWLQLQMSQLEQTLARSKSPSSQRQSPPQSDQFIEIAMTKNEQNLEIVYQNGQYYFEALHSFRVSLHDSLRAKSKHDEHQFCDAKPKAWLAKEIESKIALKPGKSWLNGTETYYCLMCNQFSPYSNLLLLHMILTCPKLTQSQSASPVPSDMQSYSTNNKDSNNNGPKSPELHSPNKGAPKRSFDIMSLLNQPAEAAPEYSQISSDDNNEDSDEKIDVETLEEAEDSTAFGLLKPVARSAELQSTQALNFESFANANGSTPLAVVGKAKGSRVNSRQQKSAFKKLKATEPETLDLAALRKGPENLVPNLMPNLANLYSQFGSSLFANTFASFFQPNPGANGQPLTHPHSSLLGSIEHAFTPNYPPANFFPPANHLGPMRSPPMEPSPPKFASNSLSLPSAAKLSPPASLYHSSAPAHHHRSHPAHSFDALNSQSPLSTGPSSILSSSSIASNSPGSLSDSSSNSVNSSSMSPSISLSPEYESHKRSASGEHHKENSHKSSGKKNRSHSPAPNGTGAANSSGLNLPPYFMPPSSTASNPLISSMYLLSPSLTALSYQASNVCAYCNTAFRMTSDLVYHMRSHHKKMGRDQEISSKKRRNDALKCNICQETFRERHHLTRHMTSHQ